MWGLKEKSFTDVLEERIHTNPVMTSPFDAACKYAQKVRHENCTSTSVPTKT